MDDAAANTALPVPGSNTPFAILTHCLDMMRRWSSTVNLGVEIPRDRDAEFRARGSVPDLLAEAARVPEAFVADVRATDLDAAPAAVPDGRGGDVHTADCRAVLIHVVEELAQHLGHLEITRDVLAAGVLPPAETAERQRSATPAPDVQVIDAVGVPTAVVRTEGVRLADLPAVMDRAFTALRAAIGEGAFRPAGPAFARYDADVRQGLGETFAVEVGFPLDAPLPAPLPGPSRDPLGGAAGDDGPRVVPSWLPAGRLAITRHVGPYEGLPEAWPAFVARIAELGHAPGDLFWEAYETQPGPDVDPATLVTALAVPLRD